MNLRQRFVLLHTLLVSVILVTAFFIIYIIYANTREDDFDKRLWVQAIASYKNFDTTYTPAQMEADLLANSSIAALPNPFVLILNNEGKVVYEKTAGNKVAWSGALLAEVKKGQHYLFRDGMTRGLAFTYPQRAIIYWFGPTTIMAWHVWKSCGLLCFLRVLALLL